jgi:retinol-binding protein 3
MRCFQTLAALAGLMLACMPVAEAAQQLSHAEQGEAVDSLARLYEDNYHDPERGRYMGAALRAHFDDGAYDRFTDPESLAARLSEDIGEWDPHAHIEWQEGEGQVEAHHSVDWAEFSRRANHGVERVERLPGNVGLIRLRMLSGPDIAGDTIRSAMAVASNADALIIDLRANGGGEPEAVSFLMSFLMGADPVPVHSVYWADRDETQVYWTRPEAATSSLYTMPIFVLATPATGSAAEILVNAIKRSGRGVVVGQNTYGARNPGSYMEGRHGFHAFVSYGRPGDADHDESWDQGGVAPDIATVAGEELSRALELAWSEIENSGDADQIAEIAFARARQQGLEHPVRLSTSQAQAYVGQYGGRRVTLEDGQLYYVRGRRAPLAMIAAGSDRFFVREFSEFRVDFVRADDGEIRRMDVTYNDTHVEPNVRD